MKKYKEYTRKNVLGQTVYVREYPPQIRSIRIAWYDDDPDASGKLISKKLFRLQFPKTVFVFFSDKLYLLFKIGRTTVFPALPNVFYDNKICLDDPFIGIDTEQEFDQAVEDFWNSQFWEYQRPDMKDGGWPGAERLYNIVNKKRQRKLKIHDQLYRQWEQWSLKEVNERMLEQEIKSIQSISQKIQDLVKRIY